MSIVRRVLNVFGRERRSLKEGGIDRYWSDFLATRGGGAVTPKRAESISAVYACVAAISETIASLPLVLYRRAVYDDRERATDHPLYRALHSEPNGQQSALEFREQILLQLLVAGPVVCIGAMPPDPGRRWPAQGDIQPVQTEVNGQHHFGTFCSFHRPSL